MQKAIKFVNFTNQSFSWTWDGVGYSFPAHSEHLMPDWQANHFAKHLVNHVLNTQGKLVNDGTRPALLAKALPGDEQVEAQDEAELNVKVLAASQNKEEKPEEEKKQTKPRAKRSTKIVPVVSDEHFDGLEAV